MIWCMTSFRLGHSLQCPIMILSAILDRTASLTMLNDLAPGWPVKWPNSSPCTQVRKSAWYRMSMHQEESAHLDSCTHYVFGWLNICAEHWARSCKQRKNAEHKALANC